MHFFPLGNPSRQSSQGKHDGKHVFRDADCSVDNAAVEIDVRVEFSLDEVFIGEGNFLQSTGKVEQGIVDSEEIQHPVAGALDDRRTGVKILVDTMPKTHQTKIRIRVLCQSDIFIKIISVGVDPFQHPQYLLVCTTMKQAPNRSASLSFIRK